jgi:hypothetical protein
MLVKGTKSKYINRHNIPVAESFFPNMVCSLPFAIYLEEQHVGLTCDRVFAIS